MVDHLTTITAERSLDEGRAFALDAALMVLGFERHQRGGRTMWTSTAVEAGAAKVHLRQRGFRDREFRVVLEYVRQWGIM